MASKALLVPAEPDDFRKRYDIPGWPHLRVEAAYDETGTAKASVYGYVVVDRRRSELSRLRQVGFFQQLQDVREWVKRGCPGAPQETNQCGHDPVAFCPKCRPEMFPRQSEGSDLGDNGTPS